jgi:beta-galactosidase
VVRHRYGKGSTWYLGTRPDPSTMDELVRGMAAAAGVEPELAGLPSGVEAVSRYREDGTRYRFLLNHTTQAAEVSLPDRTIHLGPREAAIVCISS